VHWRHKNSKDINDNQKKSMDAKGCQWKSIKNQLKSSDEQRKSKERHWQPKEIQ